MATNLNKFESLGGFSVDETVHIDEEHNAMSLNTIEMKNQFYSDSKTTNYILRGVNTATLQLDNVGTQITIDSNTVNFITGHFLGVNPSGVVFTGKIESAVYCNAVGATSVLSSLLTIIKDDIPDGQTWSIDPLGGTGTFSYNTVRAGTTNTIKWIAHTKVVSIDWG